MIRSTAQSAGNILDASRKVGRSSLLHQRDISGIANVARDMEFTKIPFITCRG